MRNMQSIMAQELDLKLVLLEQKVLEPKDKKIQQTKLTQCKCGTTTHLKSRSKACHLNKAHFAAKKLLKLI